MSKTHFARLACLLLVPAAWLAADTLEVQPFQTTFLGVDTTGTIQTSIGYTFGGKGWVNNANPLTFVSDSTLQGEGLEDPYVQALSNMLAAGWSYNYSDVTLADGSFLAQTYDVQGPTPPATNSDAFAAAAPVNPFSQNCVNNNNCVGQEFQVAYDASGDDPTDDLHWIQVLYTNFDGTPAYEIDNGGGTIPYYDENGTADPSGFLDLPGIANAGKSYFFDAEAYLVSGPVATAPGAVTIYDAIDWGWQNTPTPEPATYVMAGAALGLIAFTRRRRRQGREAVPQESR